MLDRLSSLSALRSLSSQYKYTLISVPNAAISAGTSSGPKPASIPPPALTAFDQAEPFRHSLAHNF